jgi:hypothetical protein
MQSPRPHCIQMLRSQAVHGCDVLALRRLYPSNHLNECRETISWECRETTSCYGASRICFEIGSQWPSSHLMHDGIVNTKAIPNAKVKSRTKKGMVHDRTTSVTLPNPPLLCCTSLILVAYHTAVAKRITVVDRL